MTLEHLFDRCPLLPVDSSISMARYLHSVRQAALQALSCERSNDLERSALLNIRILQLICKTIPSHPEYHLNENQAIVEQLRQIANDSFEELDKLSNILDENSVRSKFRKSNRRDRQHLRSLQVNVSLIDVFEKMSEDSSEKGLATIGVLAGRITDQASSLEDSQVSEVVTQSEEHASSNKSCQSSQILRVAALIIPSQRSTEDGSEMCYEADLFALQEHKGLVTLGWILMRPSDTRITLSTSAAHTQAGFQLMMAEAPAIVVAPKDPVRFRAFTLTDPGGLGYVLACGSRSVHAHDATVPPGEQGEGRPVFCEAEHVAIIANEGLDFKLYDLRPLGADRDSRARS